jgi:hypothetical protein
MSELSLTRDELQRIETACSYIRISTCPEPLLQPFIAARLEAQIPQLAAKVRRLDAAHMDSLCQYLKAVQGMRA